MRILPLVVNGSNKYTPLAEDEIIQNVHGIQFKWNTLEKCWRQYSWPNKDGSTVYGETGPVSPTTNSALDSGLGLRYNAGKVKFSLVPQHWIRMLAQILTVGAKKYAPHNWKKGLVHSEVLDSLHRHLNSFMQGEVYDPETKCHHLGHVAWNALALMTLSLQEKGVADLPTDDNVKTMED